MNGARSPGAWHQAGLLGPTSAFPSSPRSHDDAPCRRPARRREMSDVNLRNQTVQDAAAIRQLIIAAFATAAHSCGREQDLMEALWMANAATVALVAEFRQGTGRPGCLLAGDDRRPVRVMVRARPAGLYGPTVNGRELAVLWCGRRYSAYTSGRPQAACWSVTRRSTPGSASARPHRCVCLACRRRTSWPCHSATGRRPASSRSIRLSTSPPTADARPVLRPLPARPAPAASVILRSIRSAMPAMPTEEVSVAPIADERLGWEPAGLELSSRETRRSDRVRLGALAINEQL